MKINNESSTGSVVRLSSVVFGQACPIIQVRVTNGQQLLDATSQGLMI